MQAVKFPGRLDDEMHRDFIRRVSPKLRQAEHPSVGRRLWRVSWTPRRVLGKWTCGWCSLTFLTKRAAANQAWLNRLFGNQWLSGPHASGGLRPLTMLWPVSRATSPTSWSGATTAFSIGRLKVSLPSLFRHIRSNRHSRD